MNNLAIRSTLAALVAISTTCNAEEKAELSFSSTEVAPGLYMLMGVGGFTGGNIGLSIGDDGVVMIDDSMPPMLDIMKTAIASVTDKPVDFLINTHVHGDHTGNNATLASDGAHIVAHENLRRHLVQHGVQTADGMKPAPKAALPVITFSREMDFYLNGQDAHLFHVAHAHTDGDSVIQFRGANVIHTGDVLFNGLFPFIDLDSGGSVEGYLAAQKQILALVDDKTRIIPGHGPLAGKADLKASVDMLEDSIALIKAQIKAGKSEDEVVAMNPLAKYHDKWNWGFITTEKMTRQLYAGLKSPNASATSSDPSGHGHEH
ncbi:MBL fold metallo-hydrolase [Dokdonella sp.]|uniref:MBL fold metallo-hydrolase n=1 Tax=Dokdonella sp. TaxID=2291710 RepID=UPI003528C0BF